MAQTQTRTRPAGKPRYGEHSQLDALYLGEYDYRYELGEDGKIQAQGPKLVTYDLYLRPSRSVVEAWSARDEYIYGTVESAGLYRGLDPRPPLAEAVARAVRASFRVELRKLPRGRWSEASGPIPPGTYKANSRVMNAWQYADWDAYNIMRANEKAGIGVETRLVVIGIDAE